MSAIKLIDLDRRRTHYPPLALNERCKRWWALATPVKCSDDPRLHVLSSDKEEPHGRSYLIEDS